MEMHALGLWQGVRQCEMPWIAKSVGVILEDCMGRKKVSLLHIDSLELSLESSCQPDLTDFFLEESAFVMKNPQQGQGTS